MNQTGLLLGKRAAFLSLGCKVNAYETEAMRELFEEAGAQTVDFEACADIYVVNTCTVTNIADRKSRQMLHRAKKKNPQGIVVAVGCYVQAAEEDLKKDFSVDVLVGNNHKNEVVDLVLQYMQTKSEKSVKTAPVRGECDGLECKAGLPNPEEIASMSKGRDGLDSVSVLATSEETVSMGKEHDDSEYVADFPISEETASMRESHDEKNDTEQPPTTDKLSLVGNISREKDYEKLSITVAEKTRAYIKVQDGCNQFCTYCIIPFARGRIRSRDIGEVEAEVRRLAAEGYQEIVLTGIHLSSYGMEAYPERERFALQLADEDMPLVRLIQCLDRVPGITRIRLGSLEPRIVTEQFAAAIAATKVCPHFHLSLQSGCDATLRRMNRRYDTGEYLKSCEILRRYFDRPAITTDVIVGFPGETKEEFEETVQFVQKVQFAQMHIFKYSRRKGTKAAEMPGQVAEETKAGRSDELLAIEKEMRRAYEQLFTGQETEVLFEEGTMIDGQRFMVGHNGRYIKFAMQTEEDLSNQCIKGRINGDFAGEIPVIERKQSK